MGRKKIFPWKIFGVLLLKLQGEESFDQMKSILVDQQQIKEVEQGGVGNTFG